MPIEWDRSPPSPRATSALGVVGGGGARRVPGPTPHCICLSSSSRNSQL